MQQKPINRQLKNEDFAKLLIDARAHLNIRSLNGETALMAATKPGHKEIVNLLRDAGVT